MVAAAVVLFAYVTLFGHNNQTEVVATDEDERVARELVVVARTRGKGWGVFAKRRIPAWTCLGPYPGKVYEADEHRRLKALGILDHQYALDFWKTSSGGPIDENYVIDPRFSAKEGIEDRYKFITQFINEPDGDDDQKGPNVAWVWNFPKGRVELWTARDVEAGRELTTCYGQGYGRDYASPCQADGVEFSRYAIGYRDQARPVLWGDVVHDGKAPRY